MNFIYVTKSKSNSTANVEVAVTYIKSSCDDRDYELRFSISQNIMETVFRNVEFIIAAYDTDCPDKIWFKEAHKDIGYKISKTAGTRKSFVPIGLSDLVDDPQSFIGEYKLMCDHHFQMWYIDRRQKMK